jgi:hypothetical protein
MKHHILLTASVFLIASRALAQTQSSLLPPDCVTLIARLAAETSTTERRRVAEALADLNQHLDCLSEAVVESARFTQFLKTLESRRSDKQSGASVGAGASTNLVSKGTTAKVLSIAAEYGALTETVNKQVVTVQGSLDGVPAALVRQSLVPYCPANHKGEGDCISSKLIESLRRFSYAVSFDMSPSSQNVSGTPAGALQGTVQPVTFTADGRSITVVTARAVIWNARDTVSKSFQKAWMTQVMSSPDALKKAGNDLVEKAGAFLDTVTKDQAYKPWQDETVRLLIGASGKEEEVWGDRLRLLADLLRPTHTDLFDKAREVQTAFDVYRLEENAVVDALQKSIATFQYDFKRPPNQPETSTLRLIFDKGLGNGWSFAANGAVELYNQKPSSAIAGAGRVRDAQLGVQVQRDLGTLELLGAAALAAAYYYQFQSSPSILDVKPGTPLDGISLIGLPSTATQVFATKGDIRVAQLRLVLGPRESSARFPFAISYSNRTELLDKPAWRAQIGISYDFDSLFAK